MRWLVACVALLIALPAHAETYSIATGSPSGLYYPFGGGLAAMWSDSHPDINMKAEVTNGSVTNLIQVHKGESEVGISQGDALRDALAGAGRYPQPLELAVLFALYPNLVHVIVPADSDIRSIADLRGKRVSIGAPGSGNMVTADKVLGTLGVTREDISPYFLSYTETANALRDGTVDAGFLVGGIGVAVVVELALTRDIRLIPFTDAEMQKLHTAFPAYSAFDVPAGLYKNVDAPVQTVSLWNFLVVRRDMPDALAETLVKTAMEQPDRLRRIAYPARYTTADNTLRYGRDMLHPAALSYFTHNAPAE